MNSSLSSLAGSGKRPKTAHAQPGIVPPGFRQLTDHQLTEPRPRGSGLAHAFCRNLLEPATPRVPFGWLAVLILVGVPFCHPMHAQQYSVSDAYNILTQLDGNGFCDPQKASAYPLLYAAGCCGSPGFRVCALVLHGGKGSWGISAGCTDPDSNQVNGTACELPTPPAIPANPLPADRPATLGTSIDFLVTSDLHFYRTTYNVMDQVSHPSTMMAWAMADSLIQSGSPSPNKYGAILLAGDKSTGANDSDYHNQDYRISAYRMLWENNWPSMLGYLPGASTGLPVFPTLGNHDFNDNTWWSYMTTLTQNLHRDSNLSGCLPNITPGCLDMGGLAGTLNYSFDWEGVHFLALNTWAGDTNSSSIGGSNGLTWLQNDLQHYVGTSGKPVIVVQHYGLDANNVSGGPINGLWWTQDQINAFENVIKPYNVIGWFSGHTHDLEMNTAANTINGRSNNSVDFNGSPLGETLDNFDDGSGGDCNAHGVGTVNTPNGNPAAASYCSHAVKNFLAVHVDDQYMQVRALSYSDLTSGVHSDNSIGMIGESSNAGASCKKWIGGNFQDVTLNANISIVNNVVTVSAGSSISGPLALWVNDGITPKKSIDTVHSLSQWDFVDSCGTGSAHKFVNLTSNTLQPGQHLSARLVTPGDIPLENVHLMQLAPQFVASQSQPSIGLTPTTITISSNTGAPVDFNVAVDGGGASYTTKWLIATSAPNNQSFTDKTTFTTPQTFNLSAMNLNYQAVAELFQNIYVTDPLGRSNPLNIFMPLAAPVLSLTTNATGAQASVYTSTVNLPSSYTGEPHGGEKVPLNVVSPQFPSAGTRLVFQNWGDGGAQSHTFTLGCCGAPSSLAVNFETDYLVTPTVSAGGTVNISPHSTDGYITADSNLSLSAKPNPGYYFVGYTGGVVTTQADANEPLQGPVSFTATFAPQPQLTFTSNIPAGLGSPIAVQGLGETLPFTENFAPGVNVRAIALATFISTTNPGVKYVFQNWSDGVTTAARTIVAPAIDTTYTAIYGTQVLVTVSVNPAAGGSVTGSGFYSLNSGLTLTATPASGNYFAGFTGDLSNQTNPWSIASVTQPLNITANFLPIPQVTLASIPSNQTIYVDNVAYQTPHVFPWLPGGTHSVDATRASPPAGTRLSFTGWSDAGASVHQVTAPAANQTLTATFAPSYLLSLTTGGSGSIAASPASPTNDGYYPSSTIVSLNAVPAAGSYFTDFGGSLSGTANPQSITMTLPLTVLASFAGLPQVTVSVSSINDSDPNSVQLNLVLSNSGQGPAFGLSIVSITATDLTGTGAVSVGGLPGSAIALPPGQSATVPLLATWPSTAKRVQLKVQFTANGGAYSGSQTITMFR